MKHIGAEVVLLHLLPGLSGPPAVTINLRAHKPVVLGTDVPLPHLVEGIRVKALNIKKLNKGR